MKLNDCLSCTKCHLRQNCNQVVSGNGNPLAKIILVGEAPGRDEDILGQPFVGRSGQLLDKLLEKSGISRSSLYITNVVKCRPPDNRTPTSDEINICKNWLWQEIQLIKPQVLITLGKVATTLLLKAKPTITLGKYVGKPLKVDYMDTIIYPWYHPSFLLRCNSKFDEITVDFFREIKNVLV